MNTVDTTEFEQEVTALNRPAFVECWIDEDGYFMVTRSAVLVDDDPMVAEILRLVAKHHLVLTEEFEDDDAPDFIMGRCVCQVWERAK